MVENVLYLKFLLDPFVYAWRIPKYRQALKIILRWSHGKNKKPCRGSMFSECAIAELSLSRDTLITLDFKAISHCISGGNGILRRQLFPNISCDRRYKELLKTVKVGTDVALKALSKIIFAPSI